MNMHICASVVRGAVFDEQKIVVIMLEMKKRRAPLPQFVLKMKTYDMVAD